MKRISVVVPAAGKGLRMGREIPKQYLLLAGTAILERTLKKMLELEPVQVCLAVDADDTYWSGLPSAAQCVIAEGGSSRAESVLRGIEALKLDDEDWLLVHDAVRPLVDLADIQKLISEVGDQGGLLAVPVIDTLKQVNQQREAIGTPDRNHYWQAQTPQFFPAGILKRALQNALARGDETTDEASAMEAAGYKPKLVEGQRSNLKITNQADLLFAEFLLKQEAMQCE